MGSDWSCPDGYSKVSEDLYSSSLRLCIQKQTIRLDNYPTNITYVSDITSDAESAKLLILTTIICVMIMLLLVVN
jgi:hypothetical protein